MNIVLDTARDGFILVSRDLVLRLALSADT